MSYIMIKKNNIIQRVMNEWSFQRKEEEIDRSEVIRNGMYVQQCKQGDTTTSYT